MRSRTPAAIRCSRATRPPNHFDVYFYGCEKIRNCDSLRFEVLFKEEDDHTLQLANGWNRSKRVLQAAIKDGRLVGASIATASSAKTETPDLNRQREVALSVR